MAYMVPEGFGLIMMNSGPRFWEIRWPTGLSACRRKRVVGEVWVNESVQQLELWNLENHLLICKERLWQPRLDLLATGSP